MNWATRTAPAACWPTDGLERRHDQRPTTYGKLAETTAFLIPGRNLLGPSCTQGRQPGAGPGAAKPALAAGGHEARAASGGPCEVPPPPKHNTVAAHRGLGGGLSRMPLIEHNSLQGARLLSSPFSVDGRILNGLFPAAQLPARHPGWDRGGPA